jgi:hypothetical protein
MSLLKRDVFLIPNIMEVLVELAKLASLVKLQADGQKNQFELFSG